MSHATTTTIDVEFLSLNESNALLDAVHDIRDKAIITVFLTLGLTITECEELGLQSIDWKKRLVMVSGNKARTLPMNDQVFEALAAWSEERVDCATDAFFITQKGTPSSLSDRSIDSIIRKTAKQAGITRKVNARILRNTFAVRLFGTGIDLSDASEILGIRNHSAIQRYKDAYEHDTLGIQDESSTHETTSKPIINAVSTDLSELDTRNSITKFMSKLSPSRPKQAKILSHIKGIIEVHPEETIFGRVGVIRDLKSSLAKTQSVLVAGPLGIGKSHLLKHMQVHFKDSVYISSPTPVKQFLKKICAFVNEDYKSELKSRPSNQVMLSYILENSDRNKLLIVDQAHKLRASQIEIFQELLGAFTVLAASEKEKLKYPQIQWKFKLVELNPLTEEASIQLIQYVTQNIPVKDYEFMETRLLNLSNGYPLPIVDMVNQLRYEPVVNTKSVRGIYHEAGTTYRDWTYGIMILWGMLTIFRFVAMGRHSYEGYMLAGLGTSIYMIMKFFMFKMR